MKKTISIVIPAYNEELVIGKLAAKLRELMKKLTGYQFEVIIVDNGSEDDTLGELLKVRARDKRFKIIQLTKNEECDGGIIAGLTYAKGDAAVVMMADLQESPELIIRFVKKWEEGYDIVYGIVKRRTGATFARRVTTFVFYRIINVLAGGMVPRDVSDFRLMDKRAYQAIVSMPEHNKFFRGLSTWTAFRRFGIPFNRDARAAGVSKADFKTAWTVAINGVTSFSYVPLRIPWLIAVLAISTALSSLVFGASVEVVLISLLFAVTSAMMGAQNEYLIRVLEEVRQRPNFIIRKTYGLEKK